MYVSIYFPFLSPTTSMRDDPDEHHLRSLWIHSFTCAWPCSSAVLKHLRSFHRHPFLLAHLSTRMCPPAAAQSVVRVSQGKFLLRAPRRTVRCPPLAAPAHRVASYGQPFFRAHLRECVRVAFVRCATTELGEW